MESLSDISICSQWNGLLRQLISQFHKWCYEFLSKLPYFRVDCRRTMVIFLQTVEVLIFCFFFFMNVEEHYFIECYNIKMENILKKSMTKHTCPIPETLMSNHFTCSILTYHISQQLACIVLWGNWYINWHYRVTDTWTQCQRGIQ